MIITVKPTVTYKDLMRIGFTEHSSRDIIKQAKRLTVLEFEENRKNKASVLQLAKSPFENSRIGIAPTEMVEAIIGFPLYITESGN